MRVDEFKQAAIEHEEKIIRREQELCIVPINFRDGPLNRRLKKLADQNRQTEEYFRQKVDLRWKIYALTVPARPSVFYGLYLVGSTYNFQALKNSDLDLCLVTRDNFSDACKVTLLVWVRERLLDYFETIDDVELIAKAKVPILRFIHRATGIQVDINVDSTNGCRNGSLVRIYTQQDPRVRTLAIILKCWAIATGVDQPRYGGLPSYSLALMLIFYLQQDGILKCLHKTNPDLFKPNYDVHALFYLAAQNLTYPPPPPRDDKSVAQLIYEFFTYYDQFDFSKYIVSVRLGKPLSKANTIMRNRSGQGAREWQTHLAVEDPFTMTNTTKCVSTVEHFNSIVQAISDTKDEIDVTGDLERCFSMFQLPEPRIILKNNRRPSNSQPSLEYCYSVIQRYP